MQDYRQLRVHAKAHVLAVEVRRATNQFPRVGYASLKAQMTSAAESISFNIVEGCGADSQKEFARFLDIGIRSAMELQNQLTLARDYGVIHVRDSEALSQATIDVRRMLYGLRAKVRASIAAEDALTQKRTTEKRSTQDSKRNAVKAALEPPDQPSEEQENNSADRRNADRA